MARQQPLELYQGDDWNFIVNVTHNGVPVSLSGYTAAAQIRRSSADTDTTVDAEFTCTVGTTSITLTLPNNMTIAIQGGTYRWDLQVTSAAGVVTTLLYGPVTVHADITRVA